MTSTKHRYQSCLNTALSRRYKPVTIFVSYLPGHQPRQITLELHSVDVLINRCCNLFKIGWKRRKHVKVMTDDNIEIKSTLQLIPGNHYKLIVPQSKSISSFFLLTKKANNFNNKKIST